MNPLYSIVVTSFNNVTATISCLSSIEPYLTDEYECIVVDDGSTDASHSAIRHISQNNNRFKPLLSTKNEGVSVARNKGISAAKGNWLLFIDNDTIWKQNVFFYMISKIKTINTPSIFGMCGVCIDNHFNSIHIHNNQITSFLSVDAVPSYCLLAPRTICEENIRFDSYFTPYMHEDIDFCLQAKAKNICSYMIPHIPLIHTLHGSGVQSLSEFSNIFSNNWRYIQKKWSSIFRFDSMNAIENRIQPYLNKQFLLHETTKTKNGNIFYDL